MAPKRSTAKILKTNQLNSLSTNEIEDINCSKQNKICQDIKLIKSMRKNADAPVDLMGCQTCADANADPKVFRFQTLVALMLSSQTKDQITSAAMERLRSVNCTISSILNLSNEQLEELLKPVGFYRRKAEYLKRVCAILRDKYNDDIPNTFEGLCELPGVGPKMANLAIKIAFGRIDEGIGVDTHVHRICNRLNWIKTKTAEQTEFELREVLPKDEWSTINQLLVGFGQTICLPVRPKCSECLLNGQCYYSKKINLKKK
ncbi:Endonuclease III-like protein [Meloidogyne graminicola]|uniref:Endonuclease III homolog n=1 Tax=Meloidogyne graminicola TaxID=189291 RepID=A0A8T0A3I5_9BILA|nr:Endonuclease III-like protein [Meloidogyne graminicola]